MSKFLRLAIFLISIIFDVCKELIFCLNRRSRWRVDKRFDYVSGDGLIYRFYEDDVERGLL